MKKMKKLLSVILVLAMMLSLCVAAASAATVEGADTNPYAPTEFVTYGGVTFGRATEAYNVVGTRTTVYKGLPLFDGKEEHLEIFVDLIMSEIGDAGAMAIACGGAVTGSYENGDGETVTYTVPASISGNADVGLDGQTQWPNQMALAQSWNKELVFEAGSTYGSEVRSRNPVNTIAGSLASSASCALIDTRLNPLAGRYDEGYGEDAYMIGQFVDLWSGGMSLRDENQDLYYRAMARTKHFTNYGSEHFRLGGNNNTSVRTFYEYTVLSAERAFADGNVYGYQRSRLPARC